jgi:DNA-binding transcriptional ArsR family regulator
MLRYYPYTMTEPLSDRLLETLGDSAARQVLRQLLVGARTQNELIAELGIAQATASRALRILRGIGLVASNTGRRGEKLHVEAKDAVATLLLAADRLAEQVLHAQLQAQRDRSASTRRAAIKPAERGSAGSPEAQA